MTTQDSPIIEYYSIHDIDAKEENFSKMDLNHHSDDDLLKFLKKVAAKTRTSSSKRHASFIFNSPVKISIEKIIANNKRNAESEYVAKILLDAEITYARKMERLHKDLKKGSLVITLFTMGVSKLLMLCKIDFEKFLEKDTLKSTLGLPEEKALLKSCLIEIHGNTMSDTILLADSNGSIAKYWWDEFLKSTLTFTGKENTNKAFKAVERTISSVGNISQEDHTDLRNNLISYFKTSKSYNHDEMIERVIGDFQPQSKEVNLVNLKAKLDKIPEKKKFDGNFEVDPKEVRARAKKVYDLGNDIELITRSGDGNIYSAKKGKDEFVLIRTKMNIDYFKEYEL